MTLDDKLKRLKITKGYFIKVSNESISMAVAFATLNIQYSTFVRLAKENWILYRSKNYGKNWKPNLKPYSSS